MTALRWAGVAAGVASEPWSGVLQGSPGRLLPATPPNLLALSESSHIHPSLIEPPSFMPGPRGGALAGDWRVCLADCANKPGSRDSAQAIHSQAMATGIQTGLPPPGSSTKWILMKISYQ